MKKFEIYKIGNSVNWKDRFDLKEGCSFCEDCYMELIRKFDTKDEALEALKRFETRIRELKDATGSYFDVEEFAVIESEYNEEGELMDCGDAIAFTPVSFIVNSSITYEELKSFSTYKEAEEFKNDQEDDCFIEFASK